MTAIGRHITPGFESELLYVKWASPTEELASSARLASTLADRRIASANDVCIAVPNRNWAVQLARTCDELGIEIVDRTPARLGTADNTALMKLDVIAGAEGSLDAWRAAGGDAREARALAERLGHARGHSLAHAVGAQDAAGLAHGLRHVVGDEDAAALAALLREQAKRPTVPVGMQLISIAHYQRIEGDFAYMFLVGCVDGLLPGPAALEGDGDVRERALADARSAYRRIVGAPRVRTVLSGFAKADVRLADAAHIPYARTKRERGETLAMCSPSRFLAEEGARRPSTEGGQAMLKRYRLI